MPLRCAPLLSWRKWPIKDEFGPISIGEDVPPPIDVYRGIECSLPGIIANKSAERGGTPMQISDLRHGPYETTPAFGTSWASHEVSHRLYFTEGNGPYSRIAGNTSRVKYGSRLSQNMYHGFMVSTA